MKLTKETASEKLFDFGKQIFDILQRLNISPIVYGSLAYFYHTNDTSLPVRDIDLLLPESNFAKISEMLDKEKNITYKLMPYHSIEVFRDGLEIDIDSIEHFLDPRSREFHKSTINDLDLNILNKESLASIYKEALDNMPQEKDLDEKRNKYQKKLGNLQKLL